MLLDPHTSKIRRFAKNCVARRLLSGPFAGMRYRGNACGSHLLPKVLGTYEKEIAPHVMELIENATGIIIDVGCAEGYYSVGALYANPRIEVIAFDSDRTARETCLEIATLNALQTRLTLKERCTPDRLMETVRSTGAKVVIMDIEGYEVEILTEVGGAALFNVSIVVELHECFRPGAKDVIRRAFKDTHTITEVMSRQPVAADLDITIVRAIAKRSTFLCRRFLFERPPQMSWFIMEPTFQAQAPRLPGTE